MSFERAPFRKEALDRVQEVAQRITERVRRVLPDDAATQDALPHDETVESPAARPENTSPPEAKE
jgi:hypothetical protein